MHVAVGVSDLTEAMLSSGNTPMLVFTPDSYTDKEVHSLTILNPPH